MGAEAVGGSMTAGSLLKIFAYMVLRTGFGSKSVLVDAGAATGR